MNFISMIEKAELKRDKDADLERWLEREYDPPFLHKDMVRMLKERVIAEVLRRLKVISKNAESDLEKRLRIMQNTFGLTNEEREVVTFFFLKRTCDVVRENLDNDSKVEDFSVLMKFRAYGDMLLGVPRKSFLDAMSRGMVFKTQILDRNNESNTLSLMPWNNDYLSGIGSVDLRSEFFLMVLDVLMKSKSAKNILFYGTPGTGKTSFARSLAKKYGKEFYAVKVPESDDIKDRIRALYATVNLADANKSMVLVDEADEILNTFNSQAFRSATSKSWINMFLETHGKKIVWITNRSSEIDPSTMRRFAFAVEFKKLDPQKRLKVLKYSLGKKGVAEGYFTDEELNGLCLSHAVNAGGIVNAIDAAAVTKRTNKDKALRRIKTVLRNHEKAIGATGSEKKPKSFEQYSLKGLNTSINLEAIITSLQKQQKEDRSKVQSISMLLHGMPGTGKSEFVGYLGHALGKEVLLKRSSDIQDKFIGETEKNIATAFREAREQGHILLFDEADTFLFPRSQAQRPWEKSFTNEILTQLEGHQGIVVFTTNDMDGLDHAALRSFAFKVRFDPLNPDGIVTFYESLLSPLVQDANKLTQEDISQLRNILNLTPGDFAVIRKQYALLDPAGVTHKQLFSALEIEVQYKKQSAKAIGF
jgi:SpoVK/Ycf46/Vps4 family AAA+-type ATPase